MTSSFSQLNNSCNVMYSHSNHGHLPDHQHPHHPQSYMNQVMAANSGFFHERELQNIGDNKGISSENAMSPEDINAASPTPSKCMNNMENIDEKMCRSSGGST